MSKKTDRKSSLSRHDEKRLNQLLVKNCEGEISEAESEELISLIVKIILNEAKKAQSLNLDRPEPGS